MCIRDRLYSSTRSFASASLAYSVISLTNASLNALSSIVASSFSAIFNSASCVSSSAILSSLLDSLVTASLICFEIETSASDSLIALAMLDSTFGSATIDSTILVAFFECFTGSTNFDIIANELNKQNTGAVFAMVFILVGLSFKVSAVPFHMWTPDVYEGAPTSITNYFAVVPKVAGLAVLIKFMLIPFSNIFSEWQTILIFISIASMILGAVAAIVQKNIKRLLAYSSIGHIGYALAGVATVSYTHLTLPTKA